MLDTLSSRLSRILKTMRGQARLTEENTRDMVREIRLALLEADVALPVVRDLIARIKAKAMGEEVIGNLNPGQALVGVVERELTSVIGGDLPPEERTIRLNVQPPAVILLAGLQGAGKTTTAGKLAKWLKETQNKKVLTFSADVYRPAAIDQLKTVTEQAGCDFFPSTPEQKPLDIARDAMDWARRHFYDVVIADTAGRLAIDEQMMQEVSDLSAYLKPAETLFVIDAMLGQDAVNTAKAFNERLTLTGIILTKVDGDNRGGAALSVRMVTGKPIKFVGVGEKLTGFEPFNHEQMAGRILGMGDVLTLIEKAEQNLDEKKAAEMADKLRQNKFTLADYLEQMKQLKGMGSMEDIAGMLGMNAKSLKGAKVDEKAMARTEAIILSMTPKERENPGILGNSRKKRIAAGSGTSVVEVNRLLKQYDMMLQLVKQMSGNSRKMKKFAKMGGMPGMPGMGGFPGM